MIRPAFLFVFLSSAFLAACQNSGSTAGDPEFHPIVIADSIRGTFPYMLTNPVRSYELPADLIEVSGITCLNDTALLLVQDEIGYLYRLKLTGGEVNRHIRFAGNGDFEGVTLAGDQVWVMRSDAKLYKFSAAPGDDADDDNHNNEFDQTESSGEQIQMHSNTSNSPRGRNLATPCKPIGLIMHSSTQ